ncbi:MAG: undecaprenyl-phosphate glucose phosphotransferase [Cytophagales bacterium]|nr:MAG: undecaprenyl-phosphate glucose phosphotransferase [Cytophagales bacterium]
MKGRYSKLLRFIYLIGEIIILNSSFVLAYYAAIESPRFWEDNAYFSLLIYFNVFWLLIAFFSDNYEVPRNHHYLALVRKTSYYVLIHFVIITVFFLLAKQNYFSRLHLLYNYIAFLVGIVIWRLGILYVLGIYRSLGYNYRNVIIIGYGSMGRSIAHFFHKNAYLGYRFKGFFDDEYTGKDALGKLSDVEQYLENNEIDEIYCLQPQLNKKDLKHFMRIADHLVIRVKIVPDLSIFGSNTFGIERHGNLPVLLRRDEPLNDTMNQLLKRSFDIVFSSLVIICILSWLVPLVALLIRWESRGPLFFIQKRTGFNGKDFHCYKFRTMRVNNNADHMQAVRNDNRITKIGAFLRKTSIDELPQFINVFLGDMSVVGPRPHMLKHTEEYSKSVSKYMVRHFVKPGITGLAQAKGFRGETQDLRAMINRIRMDVFYVENWSFFLDLKIIVMTVVNMLRGEKNAF